MIRRSFQSPSSSPQGASSIRSFDDDEGLSSLISSSPIGAVSPMDPNVLTAVRDVFRMALQDTSLQWVLDPFSHADQRYRTLMDIFLDARQRGRLPDGPLQFITPTLDVLRLWYAETIGWGPAQDYLDDPKVNEVKINGTTILVQESGRPFVPAPVRFASPNDVSSRAMLVASILGVRLDASNPQETLPVSSGTRMHVTIPPRVDSSVGALVCIRRGRAFPWTLRTLRERGSLSEEAYRLLLLLVQSGCSFLVAGRTGAGKTTLMESLVNEAPPNAHILTIEDLSREIAIASDKVWTPEFIDTVTDPHAFSRAAREALRQTPDIICPGEVRGVEAGAILQLLQTGHTVVTTIHGGSADQAVRRFATLAAMQGSYLYEGRYDDALEETALGFHAVAVMEHSWGQSGTSQRVLAFVGFPDYDAARHDIRIVPAIQVEFTQESVHWRVEVPLDIDAFLGDERIPRHVRHVVGRSMRVRQARFALLTSHVVREAIQTARALAYSGHGRQATDVMQATWQSSLDMELLAAAQQLLPYLDVPSEISATAADLYAQLQNAVRACEWETADMLLRKRIFSHVAMAALCLPEEGWGSLLSQIDDGLRRERALRSELSTITLPERVEDLVIVARRIRGLSSEILTVGSEVRRLYWETRRRLVQSLAKENMLHSDVAETVRQLALENEGEPPA